MIRKKNGQLADYRSYEGSGTGSRGVGIQNLAMQITADEILAGEIRHAMSSSAFNTMFAGPYCSHSEMLDPAKVGVTCGFALRPATKVEWAQYSQHNQLYNHAIYGRKSTTADIEKVRSITIPEGMRVALRVRDEQIDEWLNSSATQSWIPARKRAARILARAFRDYGVIITDTGGMAGADHEGSQNPQTKAKWALTGLYDPDSNTYVNMFDLFRSLIINHTMLYIVEPPRDSKGLWYVNSTGNFPEDSFEVERCYYSGANPCRNPPSVIIVNATLMDCSAGNSSSGISCGYECSTGFFPLGNPAAVCANGVWSATGSCSPMTCSAYIPPVNVSLNDCPTTGGSRFGSTCTPTCSSGLTGALSATCGGTTQPGTWTTTGSCLSGCTNPPPGISNAALNDCESGSSEHASVCHFPCNINYTGSASQRCNNGVWVAFGSCLFNGCVAPPNPPTNAVIDPSACYSYSNVGATCQLLCAEGSIGDPILLSCLSPNTWSAIPDGACVPTASDGQASSDISLIAGAVGGVVGAAVFVGLALHLLRRHRKKSSKEIEMTSSNKT